MNRRIVYIRWLGHQSIDESTEYDQEVGPAIFYSVGYLTGETDEWVELTRDLLIDDGEPTEKYGALCVLKVCILDMKDLS